jgi:hypothetical protein
MCSQTYLKFPHHSLPPFARGGGSMGDLYKNMANATNYIAERLKKFLEN